MTMVSFKGLILLFLLQAIIGKINQDESNRKLYQELVDWGKANNVTLSNKIDLEFISFNKRHFIATEDINEGEILLSVPQEMFMTYEKMMKMIPKKLKKHINMFYETYYSNGTTSLRGMSEHSKEQSLMTYAIYRGMENGLGKFISFYKPFVNMFEAEADNFPILWSNEEENLFTYTIFGDKLFRARRSINYEASLVNAFYNRTLINEEYLRYRCLITAKSYHFKNHSNIIPFVDLFEINPFNKSSSWNFSEVDDSFVVKATKNITKGEIVTLSVKPGPNTNYLMFYGKTFDDNPYMEPLYITYIHSTWREEVNITHELTRRDYDLTDENYQEIAFPQYYKLAEDLKVPVSNLTAYLLFQFNLEYYLDDYKINADSEFYSKILTEENRINIRRVFDREKGFIKKRIDELGVIIDRLEAEKKKQQEEEEAKKKQENDTAKDDPKVTETVKEETVEKKEEPNIEL